MTNWLTGLEKM